MAIETYSIFDFIDYQVEADDLFSCLAELDRSVTIKLLAQLLQGRKTKYIMGNQLYRLTSYGKWAEKREDECSRIIRLFIEKGFLQCRRLSNGKLSVLLSKRGLEHFYNHAPILFIDEKLSKEEIAILERKYIIYEKLRDFRMELLERFKSEYPSLKLYHIARNETLHDIVETQPSTLEDLAKIGDMNEKKATIFGKDLLAIIFSEWR